MRRKSRRRCCSLAKKCCAKGFHTYTPHCAIECETLAFWDHPAPGSLRGRMRGVKRVPQRFSGHVLFARIGSSPSKRVPTEAAFPSAGKSSVDRSKQLIYAISSRPDGQDRGAHHQAQGSAHAQIRARAATRTTAHVQLDLHRLRPHSRVFHQPQGHGSP